MQHSMERKLGRSRLLLVPFVLGGFSSFPGSASNGPCTSCHFLGIVCFLISLEVCCFLLFLFFSRPSSCRSITPSRSTNVSILVLSFNVWSFVPPLLRPRSAAWLPDPCAGSSRTLLRPHDRRRSVRRPRPHSVCYERESETEKWRGCGGKGGHWR